MKRENNSEQNRNYTVNKSFTLLHVPGVCMIQSDEEIRRLSYHTYHTYHTVPLISNPGVSNLVSKNEE